MSISSSALPDFENPPVTEVALALQFESPVLDLMKTAALDRLLRVDRPGRSEQPPRPRMGEVFEPIAVPQFAVQLFDRPPLPRFWYLSADEARLVQVQEDLLAVNWRKIDDSHTYPRYSSLREEMLVRIGQLKEVVEAEGGSIPSTDWCEVTYVNQVVGSGTDLQPLGTVIPLVDTPDGEGFLPSPEDMQIGVRYLVAPKEEPIGRLVVSASPALRNDGSGPIWNVTLTARLKTVVPYLEETLSILDIGHEWVVRGFAELTSSSMHRAWGMRGAADAD